MIASTLDFVAINKAAMARSATILPALLPDGKRTGAEWVARNPRRNDRSLGSFSVNMNTGCWADFSSGEKGGDLISLVKFIDELPTQVAAAQALVDRFGLHAATGFAPGRKPSSDWRPMIPAPADAPDLTDDIVRQGRCNDAIITGFHYYDEQGRFIGSVARYDQPNAQQSMKTYRTFVFCENDRGTREWCCMGFPEPRPLYGLRDLALDKTAPVIIVEGEKAVDAATLIFPDHVIITSPNGAKSPHKADWTPLKGRRVVIWPDADAPGTSYAEAVCGLVEAAGASDVRVAVLPAGLPDGWDLADPLPHSISRENLVKSLAAAVRPTKAASMSLGDVDQWQTPDMSLMGSGRRRAPDFPPGVLGPFWTDWASDSAKQASAPVDYIAVALLAAAGAILANVRWAQAGANWCEPPILWCGMVGSPSSGKSPALDIVVSLVRYAEEQMAMGFDEEQRRYETLLQIAKAQREAWEADVKAAIKDGRPPPSIPDDAVSPDELVRPRIRVSDCTTEKLAVLAAGLPRGLLLFRDELAGWLSAFDRYGGAGSDRAFALEMYGGRPYVVDRVKNTKPCEIRHLSVGIIGGIQPDKLSAVLEGADDGLVPRFLWTWPEVLPEFNLMRETLPDGEAKAAFARLGTLAMSQDEHGNPEPLRLKLTTEAEDIFEDFAKNAARRTNESSGMLLGALGKARGQALRLAIIIELLWWCGGQEPEPVCITEKAMAAAITLMNDYILPMAERVYGDAIIPLSERNAMKIMQYVSQNKLPNFNARELGRTIGGGLRVTTSIDAACAILVEAGLIRPCFNRAGETKGRRAKSFEVNQIVLQAPSVLGAKRVFSDKRPRG